MVFCCDSPSQLIEVGSDLRESGPKHTLLLHCTVFLLMQSRKWSGDLEIFSIYNSVVFLNFLHTTCITF